MIRVNKAKRLSVKATTNWAWDAFSIAIAISMGFGPYALLSILGSSQVKQMVYDSTAERSIASIAIK